MKKLQVLIDGEWKYVFSRTPGLKDPVTTDSFNKAISAHEQSMAYMRHYFENHQFQYSDKEGMSIEEISKAVDNGKTVCWSNNNYHVIDSKSGYMIKCIPNGNCQYLTYPNGNLMEDPGEFFIEGKQ